TAPGRPTRAIPPVARALRIRATRTCGHLRTRFARRSRRRSRAGPDLARGLGLRGGAQVDQLDAELFGDPDRLLVTVELAVVDARDAAVGDQLEAVPAGARGRVDLAPFDPDAVLGRLDDRIRLGVDRADAVPGLHVVADLVA